MERTRLNYERVYLTCPTNTGSKFWECVVEGTVYTVRFGSQAIGAKVQTRSKEYGTHAEAVAEMAKIVANKEKHGYTGAGYD